MFDTPYETAEKDAPIPAIDDLDIQTANHGLTVIVTALKKAEMAFNFTDLALLVTNENAIIELEQVLPNGPEKENLTTFLNTFRKPNAQNGLNIDMSKLTNAFSVFTGRQVLFA